MQTEGCCGAKNKFRPAVLVIAILVIATTFIPLIYGFSIEGKSERFGWYSGFYHNLNDQAAYLSWIAQLLNGGLFHKNFFTTEHQPEGLFNLFFVLTASFSRFTGFSPLFFYHAIRGLFGIIFFMLLWQLINIIIKDERARWGAYIIACTSSGLGWIWKLFQGEKAFTIDLWQSEALNYFSVYYNPLFCIALVLMLGFHINMLSAEGKSLKKTGKEAAIAAICMFILGNVHTYDIITVFSIWISYLAVKAIINKRLDYDSILRTLIAGLSAGITSGYLYFVSRSDPVFLSRFRYIITSPPYYEYLIAFGLPFILTAASAFLIIKNIKKPEGGDILNKLGIDRERGIFLIVWIIINSIIIYIPFSFQRKLIMGIHIPICILAGAALYYFFLSKMRKSTWIPALALVGILFSVTNWFIVNDDVKLIETNGPKYLVRPFLYKGETDALIWISKNTPKDAAVQPLPWIARVDQNQIGYIDASAACYAPWLAQRPVAFGHWGETPDYYDRIKLWTAFMLPGPDDNWKQELLRSSRVKYIIFTQKHDETADEVVERQILKLFREKPPEYLQLIPEASNKDADVYKFIDNTKKPNI